ncbi:unnamed protein product [Adineta steineri]|uniref:Uncharacterized protein n=1 Tax=Adineta steineri TaxID=433720 RepID=A0A815RZS1_9BILA|nr:unnamed protein product [Adineta steineri]
MRGFMSAADVLTFSDDKFYNYVRNLLGEATAGVLNVQCINNEPSFLLIENICELIELGSNSEELEEIRKKTTFAYRDGSYRVKIGIKNYLNYLNKLLSSKVEEENKKIRNSQNAVKITDSTLLMQEEENNPISQQSTTTIDTTLSLIEISPDPALHTSTTKINSISPFVETETNLSLQPLTTTETSQMFDQLPISTSVTSPEPINKINLRTPALLSKDDHTEFLLNLVKKWNQANKDLHFGQIQLVPDIDYKINITHDNNVLQGIIICNCGTRVKLRTRSGKFQITNFYKHLRTPSCSMMKEKKKNYNEQNQSTDNTNDNDCINTTDNDDDNTDNDVDNMDDDVDNIDDDVDNMDNDVHNMNDSQQIVSQQTLLEISTNVLASQPSQVDASLLSTRTNAKRNSSHLRVTSSQQSSSKKRKT